MPNPISVLLTQNTWVSVATNVTTGVIRKSYCYDKGQSYLSTYRATGEAPPSGTAEGSVMFVNSNSEFISATAGIDVYVMAVNNSGAVEVCL
jgi:hypothetical protein